MLIAIGGASVASMYYNTLGDLPDITELKHVTFETPMQIYTSDGKLIGEFGEHKRIPVEFDKIPLKLKQAFLAIEDSRFYSHSGVDPIGIVRAGIVSLLEGQASQGASTITQQVARNFYLTRDKTLSRKLKEVFISFRMEQLLSKDEIFELYLNKIALGHRAYGVAAAAQTYYGKTLDQLTLGQIATIAGLPKAPSTLNPISYPQRALNRRNTVLSRMLELGYISKDEYENAKKEDIHTYYHSTPIEVYAPYVAEEARIFALDKFGEDAYTKGINIYTTINSSMQNSANYAVFKGLTDYDTRHGYRGAKANIKALLDTEDNKYKILKTIRSYDKYYYIKAQMVQSINTKDNSATLLDKDGNEQILSWKGMSWARKFISDTNQGEYPKKVTDILKIGDIIYTYENDKLLTLTQVPDVEAGLIALNQYTGQIDALVGGYDYAKSKFNHVTQGKRQTGSNFKPFLYSAAIASGINVNSVLLDEPIQTWDPGSQTWWMPKNTPNKFEGPMTLREGLAKSKNVVSIRLIRQVGVDAFVEHLKKFNIFVPKEQQVESMALGTVELTPMQTLIGYSTFANGGYLIEPYLVQKIDENDQTIYEHPRAMVDSSAPDIVENNTALEYKDGVSEEQKNITPKQVLSHAHAYIVSDLLKSVVNGGEGLNGHFYGTGQRAARLTQRSDISGKTGTTNKVHDAWFTGFNANMVVTTWVGFDNDRNLGFAKPNHPEGGAYTAIPIFAQFFKEAQKDVPESNIQMPSDIIYTTNARVKDIAISNGRAINESNEKDNTENTGINSTVVDESNIF